MGAYRTKPRDKAIRSAISRYLDEQEEGRMSSDPRDLPDALASVRRFFSRQFQREQLAADEELTGVELWCGRSSNPPPGSREDSAVLAARQRALDRYYTRPFEHRPSQAHARIGDTDVEGDIGWTLIDAGQP
jgi:hypothetical protein